MKIEREQELTATAARNAEFQVLWKKVNGFTSLLGNAITDDLRLV